MALPVALLASPAAEEKLERTVVQVASLQTRKSTWPVLWVSGSEKVAEKAGVSELARTASAGVSEPGTFGLAFAVEFVTAAAPKVAAPLPTRSVSALPA